MDNRLKFLYCYITELWGHGKEARALNGNRVQAQALYGRQIPHIKQVCDAERKKVVKSVERPSRKAAIVYIIPVP